MGSLDNQNKKNKEIKPKTIKLRAFKIENSELSKSSSPAKEMLLSKLKSTSTVKERCLILAPEDPKNEQDLIPHYQVSEKSRSVFCTMVRVAPSEGVEKIPDVLFDKPSFTMSELQSAAIDTTVVCKNHFYFCMSDDFLVTNLPLNKTVSSLQTYIRWLAEDELIEFTPMIVNNNQAQLKDLKNITIKDPSPISQQSSSGSVQPQHGLVATGEEEKNTKIKLTQSVMDAIKSAVPGLTNLKEIIDNQIVSAELLIKFNKPRKMKEDDYARILGATLKPVSDLDNIVFKRSDGRADIKGKDLLKIKNVTIEVTESGKLVEQSVFQEMSRFLIEIQSEKSNS